LLIYQCFKSCKAKLKYVTLEVQIGPCVKVHGCNFISSIWLFGPWTHYHVSSSFHIAMWVNFIHEHNFIHAWYNSFVLKITLIIFSTHVITFNRNPMIITYKWSISSMNNCGVNNLVIWRSSILKDFKAMWQNLYICKSLERE